MFGRAKRVQLEEMLLEKLPDILTEEQKKNKIKNVLQSLKRNNKIRLDEASAMREWILV
jgi:ATP-dependent DNA helicase RecG